MKARYKIGSVVEVAREGGEGVSCGRIEAIMETEKGFAYRLVGDESYHAEGAIVACYRRVESRKRRAVKMTSRRSKAPKPLLTEQKRSEIGLTAEGAGNEQGQSSRQE